MLYNLLKFSTVRRFRFKYRKDWHLHEAATNFFLVDLVDRAYTKYLRADRGAKFEAHVADCCVMVAHERLRNNDFTPAQRVAGDMLAQSKN